MLFHYYNLNFKGTICGQNSNSPGKDIMFMFLSSGETLFLSIMPLNFEAV